MGTLTSLMNLSREALMADQAALDVTATNVANQNTPGYTRQVVSWESTDAVTLNGVTYGTGVKTTAVSQRDRILEQRVQQQTQVQAQSGALESALQQVQNIFGLTSTGTSASTALGSATDAFFSSLSSLAANPADAATRQSVLTAANTLASVFNSSASQLAQVGSSLDQQVGTIVGQVNTLTATIASLNQQIASTGAHGDAGALEDQRQLAITQLSRYVGLNQMTTDNNGITLTTSNGAVLVSGSQSFAMSTTQVAGTTHVLAGVGQQDVTSALTGGQLGGVLEARDQKIPAYASALSTFAYGLGIAINVQNELGLDGNGNPGTLIFSYPTGTIGTVVVTTNPQVIAAASVGEGPLGNGNAIALAELSTANVAGGQTASGFLATLLGQIGNDTAGASTQSAAQQATLSQMNSQRNALSSVSLDEEASNLTQYQRSYEAAAKVFSIVNSLPAIRFRCRVCTKAMP